MIPDQQRFLTLRIISHDDRVWLMNQWNLQLFKFALRTKLLFWTQMRQIQLSYSHAIYIAHFLRGRPTWHCVIHILSDFQNDFFCQTGERWMSQLRLTFFPIGVDKNTQTIRITSCSIHLSIIQNLGSLFVAFQFPVSLYQAIFSEMSPKHLSYYIC